MSNMEKGYEIIFITPENRRHNNKRVCELITDMAKKRGISRMTKRIDREGLGAGGHLHSAHFFELADQPVEIMFVVDSATGDQLIEDVKQAGIHVFCIRKEVEYGVLG